MAGAVGSRVLARVAAIVGVALVAALALPAATTATHASTWPRAPFDGEAATTERLFARHPRTAALAVSAARFPDPTARPATRVVLAREDDFADALAGSALTGDGPLLLTPRDRLPHTVAAELSRVLPGGGRVDLLGGLAAISAQVEEGLRRDGYEVSRFAGGSRVETAVAVADAVRDERDGGTVLLARAYGRPENPTAAWADAVGAGGYAAATRVPVLLTPSEGLHTAVASWLADDDPTATVLLGGPAALSEAIAGAVPRPRRVAGAERQATAAAVATTLWGVRPEGPRAFVTTDGYRHDGWAYGLAAAGLAADAGAPVLLAGQRLAPSVRPLLAACGEPEVELLAVGDGSVVSAGLREELDALDGEACGQDATVQRAAALSAFDACAAVLDAFRDAALERVGPYGLDGEHFHVGPVPLPEARTGADSGGDEGGQREAASPPSSDTNVQEAGVDEPDMVKTDGQLALVVARGRLQVVDVTGAAPRLHATVALPAGYRHEVLLDAGRALVLTAVADESARTVVTSIDLADPAAPRVVGTLELDGVYRSARLVDGIARIVVQHAPQSLAFTFPVEETPEAEQDAAEHNRDVVRASTLENWLPGYRVRDDAGERAGQLVGCEAVHRPPWFSGLDTTSVVTVPVAGPLEPAGAAAVTAGSEVVYGSASGLYVTTSRFGDTGGFEPDDLTTEVHAFAIAGPGTVGYVGSGQVPGRVLNQFALSEHAGHLRLATTTGFGEASESGVTVLAPRDGALVPVGAVMGLGRGERITAVRFLGDLAAVVTFREVDPLFLLDLSEPTAPRVTGELKIPGFSSYLHRVSDDRLLGVGQDADEEGRSLGTQVSLFDIADRTAPTRVAQLRFGPGFSEVADDHRSFLFWPPTGLAVMPLLEHDSDGEFIGAVGVRVGTGSLSEVGRVEHPTDPEEWRHVVRRAFVVGEALYTVSEAGIEVGDLATLAERAFMAFD